MIDVFWVTDFSELYETAESRKLAQPMKWIKMPTHHDGDSYRRIAARKNKERVLCAFWLTIQVAAKCPVRGLLATSKGPMSFESIGFKTGLSQSAFAEAFPILCEKQIDWIRKLQWDETLSFWENVEKLDLVPAYHGRRQRTNGHDGTYRDTVGDGRTREKDGPVIGGAGHNGGQPDTTGHAGVHKRRVQETTGQDTTGELGAGTSGALARSRDFFVDVRLTDFPEAKKIICEKILGTDPGMPWSSQANKRLKMLLTEGAGLPLAQVNLIAWFRGLPHSEEIPELRDRKVVTDTVLMMYWSDEYTRALGYWRKHYKPPEPKKPEPQEWREFFRWKYPEGLLPASWDELGADQHAEYKRDFARYQQRARK